MAKICLKDLPRSDALDRRALRAVVGGARGSARAPLPVGTPAGNSRIVDYPPGFGTSRPPVDGDAQPCEQAHARAVGRAR
jgi:hypothetical protein